MLLLFAENMDSDSFAPSFPGETRPDDGYYCAVLAYCLGRIQVSMSVCLSAYVLVSG